jgi:hypothetical protein
MPELGQITLRKPSPYRTSRHIAFGPEADQSKFDCKLVLSDDPISRPNVLIASTREQGLFAIIVGADISP